MVSHFRWRKRGAGGGGPGTGIEYLTPHQSRLLTTLAAAYPAWLSWYELAYACYMPTDQRGAASVRNVVLRIRQHWGEDTVYSRRGHVRNYRLGDQVAKPLVNHLRAAGTP